MTNNTTTATTTTVVTHDGPRHADEVMALARLAAGRPVPPVILFTRNPAVLRQDGPLFVDVGGVYDPARRRFDHHFLPVPRREPARYDDAHAGLVAAKGEAAEAGETTARLRDAEAEMAKAISACVPFSSFGLMSPADEKDHPLVRHVDALDNGKVEPPPAWWTPMSSETKGDSIAWAVHEANPVNLDGSPVTDDQFEARALALIALFQPLFGWDGTILEDEDCAVATLAIQAQLRVWHAETAEAKLASADRVRRATAAQAATPVLVLDQFEVSALDTATEADHLLYVVFPGPGGRQWMVQQVAVAVGSFEGRRPLPEAWAGLRDEAFARASGVADGVFCHAGRFICGAASREGAIALAQLACEDGWRLVTA